ncbi:Anaphase-promoting complex subunit 1 [Lecanora helva]
MASVTSLGVHQPSAIPFLVEEGILPPDPGKESYTWQTIEASGDGENGKDEEEELVTTEFCVVWSRGDVIQRVFRFDVEGEPVTHAVFTRFHSQSDNRVRKDGPVSNKLDVHESRPNGELQIPKQRSSRPSDKRAVDSNVKLDKDETTQSDSLQQEKQSIQKTGERALVVVLRSHAHVFFLTQTSHVVHLPFQVDAVFPSIHGLLLQRKLPERGVIPPTPQIPSAPNNSFAFSQGFLSSSPPNSQPLANLKSSDDSNSPISSLLKNLLESSSQPSQADPSRLFSLTDPLAEVGVVASTIGSTAHDSRKATTHRQSVFGNLDPKDTLLYVSPRDELARHGSRYGSPEESGQPVAFAVTENEESRSLSVWTVTYVRGGNDPGTRPKRNQRNSGAPSRRRSSLAPGMRTGTATPTAKNATSMRESFGGTKSRRQVSSDPAFDDGFAHEQDDLLDTTFGDPLLPTKSSRRVSGLLARADLSTSHDRASFPDPPGAYTRSRGGRKGASFGPLESRSSVGPELGPNTTKSHTLYGIRTSLDSVSLHEPPLDDYADDLHDLHDLRNLSDPVSHAEFKAMRTEVLLTKIYTMPDERAKRLLPADKKARPARKIITLRQPEPGLGEASDNAAIAMCLVDRVAQECLILQITIKYLRNPSQSTKGMQNVYSGHYRARVTGLTRQSHIIDASKLSDGTCNRLLILEDRGNGMGELSLQAPWTSPRKIDLPSQLFLHNPYQIIKDVSIRYKREGGFKRILSQGPQALSELQHASSQAKIDVVDFGQVRHRVQVQLSPRNPFVKKIIKILQSILPSSIGDGEIILRGWWDTMSFVRNRSEAEVDEEWSAIVVLLFSMGVAFISEKPTEAIPRQKKKKGGLLRSSSGATTDLSSWEAMIAKESSIRGTSPSWMDGQAWEWAGREKILPSPLKKPRSSSSLSPSNADAVPFPKKSPYIIHCIAIARDFVASTAGKMASGEHGYLPTASSRDPDVRRTALACILFGLHLFREELKLDTLAADSLHQLTPVLAQIGTWLGWENWGKKGHYMLESTGMDSWLFEDSLITGLNIPSEPFTPPSILQFIESTNLDTHPTPITSLLDVASPPAAASEPIERSAKSLLGLTSRTVALTDLLAGKDGNSSEDRITKMSSWALGLSTLESLPEGVAAPLRAAIVSCQAQPSTLWSASNLTMIGREDIALLERDSSTLKPSGKSHSSLSSDATRDVHSICHSVLDVETVGPYDGSAELDRQSITRLLFKEDQRFAEAAKLVHPLHCPIARCIPESEWSDVQLLEAQQDLVRVVAVRTLSVSLGRGLLFYSARLPLLTEKFPVHGFTLSCNMKPTDTTVTADRNQFTEDKVSWAFFHAGAEAGLSISKEARGIDTSWILFNKPKELTNRHAGFLLALGLNGHLKSLAKWVAFKYLTPKHTMTSIGLLLGLSATYLGTMNTLVTRLLSIHVIRMLPPGAAELNLSPLTQTSGIMGIGLLYCQTQHRRMSEIMLSEMENTDQDEVTNPLDSLRDEGYRLAAGFALGYINLGRGKDLKGLHDMRLTERLLVLAIGIRQVSLVHILDKAAPAATVATALIYMKTQDEALARKIDVPDTVQQFDYVRPDMFLLRTVARHLIMWDDIQANSRWMSLQVPLAYQTKSGLTTVRTLTTEDMPFFNIIAGLCLSVGLKFAGSGSPDVRNLLCHFLDQFMRICRLPALSYDGKLARSTVRNCQDVVALAASCVMAGTGDLHIFRRLRSLHGRTDQDTPYGSHLAAHFAIGVLFMGGGTHTFGTSNVAVASLLCAFYPLFPNTVLDNKPHLQAFRHFWVLATERRCLITRDVDSHRPVSILILVNLHTGINLSLTAPCLLPELHTISQIRTNDPEYWTVTLDFALSSSHRAAFARHQSIYVRRRAPYDAHTSVFSTTMQALNDAQSTHQLNKQIFRWIFTLPSFRGFDRAEQALVLPAEVGSLVYRGTRGTVVDDRLMLERACLESGRAERLWNLRILLAWAEGVKRRGENLGWFGEEVVEGLRARLAMRRWKTKGN